MADKKNQKDFEKRFWKSLEHFEKGDSHLDKHRDEFGEDAASSSGSENLTGMSRRKFLALLGASTAFAAAGCQDYHDKGEIIPHNVKPSDMLVGVPNYYASSAPGRLGHGILIKTREGRPIKIDGNPDHPVNKGKIDSKTQASILDLYDPARLKQPMMKNGSSFSDVSWEEMDKALVNALDDAGGKEIALISNTVVSPTGLEVLKDFQNRFPSVKVYFTELFSDETKRIAWKKCYGKEMLPLWKWDEADVIVALESDILGVEGDPVEQSMLFAGRRDIENLTGFNRLYAVEGNMTVTGMNADYRLRLRPDMQYNFIMAILAKIVKSGAAAVSLPGILLSTLERFDFDAVINDNGINKEKADLLVKDLVEHRGKTIIYAGRSLSEETQLAVNLLNEVLGNTALLKTDEERVELTLPNPVSDFTELVKRMEAGNVGAVIHFDSNPCYTLPEDTGYCEALGKVPAVITMTELENESSYRSNYVLPLNHHYESWGDAQTRTGFYTLQQPVIAPLYNTRQKEAILLNLIQEDTAAYDEQAYHQYLKNHWQRDMYPAVESSESFERYWYAMLHDGVAYIDNALPIEYTFSMTAVENLPLPLGKVEGVTVLLCESYALGDGKQANNGMLQEMPHPVSKVTWDNYAAVSYRFSQKYDLETGSIIDIDLEGRKVTLPVLVQPGEADDFIAVELGYGREHMPVIGLGVGTNANRLMSKSYKFSHYLYAGANVMKADGSYEFASTQEHHVVGDTLTEDAFLKRHIIYPLTVAEYKNNPHALEEQQHHDLAQIYEPHDYPGIKWAMTIDMNKCIGCGGCEIACMVENNIPVVGKEQVLTGREMNWIRNDRYYSGTPEDPDTYIMPMLCQHCDQAPCENVCPVVATTHSSDGLNQMVYNRCVGTRYCSNNCPYKVRRFNFFNFRRMFEDGYYQQESVELMHNPEVTVRSRGVMEKCTFCIQRIKDAKYTAVKEGRELRGDEVQTACQQACSSNAIEFGDMNDKESAFYKKHIHPLGYDLLKEMNTIPNVTYIAKLRNTHSEDA